MVKGHRETYWQWAIGPLQNIDHNPAEKPLFMIYTYITVPHSDLCMGRGFALWGGYPWDRGFVFLVLETSRTVSRVFTWLFFAAKRSAIYLPEHNDEYLRDCLRQCNAIKLIWFTVEDCLYYKMAFIVDSFCRARQSSLLAVSASWAIPVGLRFVPSIHEWLASYMI